MATPALTPEELTALLALRDAAAALVAGIRTGILPAEQCADCAGLATRTHPRACLYYCDDCGPGTGLEDLDIADAWRRVVMFAETWRQRGEG